jgi:hypothetical protein
VIPNSEDNNAWAKIIEESGLGGAGSNWGRTVCACACGA